MLFCLIVTKLECVTHFGRKHSFLDLVKIHVLICELWLALSRIATQLNVGR